jgi:hypothetical protein
MGMSGHESAGPLWVYVKIDDYCDSSSTGTLTHVKLVKNVCECVMFVSMLVLIHYGHEWARKC